MKKILVPCDFSDSAIQAFKLAADVAQQSRGEIILLNVIELPVMHDTVLMPTLAFEEVYLKDMRERAEKDFKKMKTKWGKDIKITDLVEYGPTAPTITRIAEEKKADLIIMGTRGASGFKEFFVGSNTEKIVRWSPVPVIAIKKYGKASGIKHIVFPNTFRGEEEALTMKVKALQDFFKAKLHILYVNTPANFKRDLQTEEEMNNFAARYMLKNYTLNIYNDFSEEEGIANFTAEIKGDLIAMSTHGRRGLGHLMSGSIAEDLVNHIECPVWTWKNK